MPVTLLTVDVGNTAAKLRGWSLDADGALSRTARADAPVEAPEAEEVGLLFQTCARFDACALSSVAGDGLTDAWLERVARHARELPLRALDPGLENRTREPARVGQDRLFAARGALECLGASAIVVGVGTALTVDAVLLLEARAGAAQGPGWRRGAFLGGAIAPGPRLLARALAQGAARLFEVEPQVDPPALGRDSAEALRAGVGLGLRGAARELAREVAREAGLAGAPVALTGGARAFVRAALPGARELPDLVHFGLCAALLEHRAAPRPEGFGAA